MKNKYLFILIITLLSKSIITENSLSLKLTFYNGITYMYTTFYDNTKFYVSFSHSKLICNEASNLQNINITDDDSYPSKQTKQGLLGSKYFQITRNLNLTLNYVYSDGEKNYIGFSRGVEYDNNETLENYNLDFVSQLIDQKVIEKYYIYLPAFFDEKGKEYSALYLTLGMIPNILDNYFNQTSYAPLNTKYPKKWSITLSHIIYEDTYNSDDPVNKTFSIYADVIFTNSGNKYITVSPKYKDIFDDIFINHLNCEVWNGEYECNPSKTSKFKLFFVFNGFSHLLSNELISYIFSSKRYYYIKYDNDIDFIAIDTFAFGNYHFLFDGEENFIILMNKNKDNISDVSDICGYENRDRKQRKTHDKEYLLEWEERLKNESKKINETLEEVEKIKAELEKEKVTLEEEIQLYRSDTLKQVIVNLRKDLEAKEKEKNETIENFRKDLEEKENDKNEIINTLKKDLETKEKDKNIIIENLRNDLETKEKEKNKTIENLRKDLETKEKDKNEVINNLKSDLETKEKDKNIIIENLQKDLETKEKEKNETIENLRKDLEAKEKDKNEVINNLKSDLETKESDKTILNEQVSKNQTLMAMLIVQIILTALTFAILILFFCRVKRRENKIQNVEIGLVDKSIH